MSTPSIRRLSAVCKQVVAVLPTDQALVHASRCAVSDARGLVVDGYLVRPTPFPGMERTVGSSAESAVGGTVPVGPQEFAKRAYLYALDPLRNPVKEVQDSSESVLAMPPLLGIFNDIPPDKLRQDDVMSWAKAGFSWVVSDGEHSQLYGRMGRDQHALLGRCGLLSVQRLHREAISEHGDAFQLGARATMRPYGTTVEEAEQYYRAITFPPGKPGTATSDARGGYPVRLADREMCFTPDSLRAAETEVQGWIQFETGQYILDPKIRDGVLSVMQRHGKGRTAGFIGPFDAVIRDGATPKMADGINTLIEEAAKRGIPMGRVCGSGSCTDPVEIEEAMFQAIKAGARLICVHYMTSDLAYKGAQNVAMPFFRACKRAGF